MSRFKIFSTSVAVIALIACGQATEVNVANAQDEAAIASAAMNWTVIESESHVKFTAKQEGKDFTGEFKSFEADIRFDPDNLAGSSVTVTVPLDQIDAGSRDRNSTLPDKVWFSAKKFPEAVWTSSNIELTGEGEYLAKGELTLKGLSKPLDIPFALTIGDKAEMTATVPMNRTMWNVGEDPWNTDEWVSQQVVLDIKVAASR